MWVDTVLHTPVATEVARRAERLGAASNVARVGRVAHVYLEVA